MSVRAELRDSYAISYDLAEAAKIIRAEALRWRLPVEAILGRSHAPLLSRARHAAIRAVRAKKPELSMRAIGQLFHRSARAVHYAVHKPLGVAAE